MREDPATFQTEMEREPGQRDTKDRRFAASAVLPLPPSGEFPSILEAPRVPPPRNPLSDRCELLVSFPPSTQHHPLAV